MLGLRPLRPDIPLSLLLVLGRGGALRGGQRGSTVVCVGLKERLSCSRSSLEGGSRAATSTVGETGALPFLGLCPAKLCPALGMGIGREVGDCSDGECWGCPWVPEAIFRSVILIPSTACVRCQTSWVSEKSEHCGIWVDCQHLVNKTKIYYSRFFPVNFYLIQNIVPLIALFLKEPIQTV